MSSTSNEHYSAPADAWQRVEQVVNELTQQRNRLARAYKKHEGGDGDGIDPLRELQSSQDAIRKLLPPDLARVAPESDLGPLDMASRDLIASYWQQAQARKNTAETGFARLNDILSGGLESKRLVTVLGAPNTGKTTFVHQMSEHIASSGRPVLYVTSEDSPSALLAKTLARVGQVNYTAVLKGYETEKKRIDKALATLLDLPSSDRLRYLDATNGVTLDLIREKAQAHFSAYTAEKAKDGGPGVLVVDYLQRIARAVKTLSGMTQDLREVVTMLTERLRSLAGELDCAVIAIAAQNRANYSRGDQGALASAKESGDIEYTCDVLMALTEDKDKNRVTPAGMTPILLNVDKNRQGQRGKFVALDFWPDRQQFTEAE